MALILAAGAYALLPKMPADQAAGIKPLPARVVKGTPALGHGTSGLETGLAPPRYGISALSTDADNV
ncbi:MAG: hypothetical protein CMM23_17720 [Rhodospirillaceae bacterium]|jgi:hypothetical protein|nr:hypothetical protein [Rhodospirillaceae bacterium]|tara:strand:+ start:2440 stop:2640 length:201 start_codon:yes stop_codon:yes gene_type:complete